MKRKQKRNGEVKPDLSKKRFSEVLTKISFSILVGGKIKKKKMKKESEA